MPAKYTLYHWVVKNNKDKYSNFLPELYKVLDDKNIPYISIYDEFRTNDEILYYGTDSHWTVKGMEMAVDATIKYLNNDSVLSKYVQ